MGLIIGGVVCLVIAIGAFFISRYEKSKYESIILAHPARVGELQEMGEVIAQTVGVGNWRDYVKVSGMVQSDRPLLSEFTQSACIYFASSIAREYEEYITATDKDGNRVEKIQKRSETVFSNSRSIPFQIQDGTGAITVDPRGANIEAIQTVSEFQPYQPLDSLLRFGTFTLALGDRDTMGTTLGYRYQESIVPVGGSAFVLAHLSDAQGQPMLLKPTNSRYKFVISTKPETEVSENARQSATTAWYAALGFAGVGVVLVVLGIGR